MSALLAIVAGVILWNKMRENTWAYYSDGAELRAEVDDKSLRPVLWEDPEPHYFDGAPGNDTANAPTGPLEAAFSADGTQMLLVRWEEANRNADMFVSHWDGRLWSKPEPIKSINTPANERGPTLSRDGKYLYFASDREGGQGGYDLFVARWDGKSWVGVEPLPGDVNTAANELGPALSSDGKRLFFSSGADGSEDIFVSEVTTKDQTKPSGLAPIPKFSPAQAVTELNSDASDVQAALTARGDHVFLASDRHRSQSSGFKLYFSRVADGEIKAPEEVDLYIRKGDVTDPAVRMEGYDLLFSSNQDAVGGADQESPDYLLYRSTTREVIGYTDLSRWEQFKELWDNIAWWLLVVVAALIALIYILEKWRDITSLFHKCLAGSALVHLIALLLAGLWLIAKEISDNEVGKSEEIVIDMNALSQEELALESIPEEVDLADTTTLETQKEESEIGAPGFEPQEESPDVPNAAPSAKEAVVEAKPSMSEPTTQPVTESPAAASVLSNLTASALPEIELTEMEEREPSETQPKTNPVDERFVPESPDREASQAEPTAIADTAVESEAEAIEVTDVQPRESVDQAVESVVEAKVPQSAEESPTDQPPLESELLTQLPQAHFVDPNEAMLDESNPADAQVSNEAANPSNDLFTPGEAIQNLETTQAENGPTSDSAVGGATEATAVGSSELVADSQATDGTPVTPGESSADDAVPPAAFDTGGPSGLPELVLNDPNATRMEERDPEPGGAPANPSADTFQPSSAASTLTTTPTEANMVVDSALDVQAETGGIASTNIDATPAVQAQPTETASSPSSEVIPTSPLEPGAMTSLPESALIDLGATVTLEELDKQPGGAPADTSRDQFNPNAPAGLSPAKSEGSAIADTAATSQSDGSAIATGGRIADSPEINVRPAISATSSGSSKDTDPLAVGSLPASTLVDPATPTLEEPARNAGRPADSSKDQFKPGAPSMLATAQSATHPGTGSAVADASAAKAISGTSSAATISATSPGQALEASDSPMPGGGALTVNLTSLDSVPGSLLPAELEAPKGSMKIAEMARIIQKQRGKPGLETIKQMGGSDGTEKAINAAIMWLVNNQEEDGRWDTGKHGAKQNYDTGGTGLALLCFYGWGERHDAGKHKDAVRRGLDWLLTQQDDDGYLGVRPNMMYAHAIASIALCEAYGLTKDKRLKGPAERAIAYTLKTQSKSHGGWRYGPGQDSDTSITGWQYMAIHSARMAGLNVPEESFELVRKHLKRVASGKHGGLYSYQPGNTPSQAMVATGMFCRQLDLTPPEHPMMQESARWLKMRPMRTSGPDLYYVYYTTLALYQHQGPIWHTWNERLKETLPLIQNKVGKHSGSWDPSANITAQGGRVVSTTLATLSLEVYYRLLPMYGFRNEDADAPE